MTELQLLAEITSSTSALLQRAPAAMTGFVAGAAFELGSGRKGEVG